MIRTIEINFNTVISSENNKHKSGRRKRLPLKSLVRKS